MNRKLRFALFGNVYQAKKSLAVQKLLCLLEERKAEIFMDASFHDYLVHKLQLSLRVHGIITGNDFDADVAVSMGGDGTFLEAASRVGDKRIPMLGINMGRLGFLADISADDIDNAIHDIYEGLYTIEERSVLQVEYSEGNPSAHPYALNEVAVLKRDNSSMISIRISINGEYLTTYQADGLIINTPTGSTGYALSVGGPVMSPQSDILGLVPVAPHSLSMRPLTLSGGSCVTLTVESRNHNFLVAIDGRSQACAENVQLKVRKAPYQVQVIKRPGGSFFRTLRQKLMWGSDSRAHEC